jgi:hypothetical protein
MGGCICGLLPWSTFSLAAELRHTPFSSLDANLEVAGTTCLPKWAAILRPFTD